MDMTTDQTIVDQKLEGLANIINQCFSYHAHTDMRLKMTRQCTHTSPVLVVHTEHTQYTQDIVDTLWHQLIDMVCSILRNRNS